jgi:hypothetical protein
MNVGQTRQTNVYIKPLKFVTLLPLSNPKDEQASLATALQYTLTCFNSNANLADGLRLTSEKLTTLT